MRSLLLAALLTGGLFWSGTATAQQQGPSPLSQEQGQNFSGGTTYQAWTPSQLTIETSNKGTLSCTKENGTAYLCGSDTILRFDPSSRSYAAVSAGVDNKIQIVGIRSVKDGSDVIYEASQAQVKALQGQGLYNQSFKNEIGADVIGAIDTSQTSQSFRKLHDHLADVAHAQAVRLQNSKLSDYQKVGLQMADGKQAACQKSGPEDCQLYTCSPQGVLYMPRTGESRVPEYIGFNEKGFTPWQTVVKATSQAPKAMPLFDISGAVTSSVSPLTGQEAIANGKVPEWPANLKDQADAFNYLTHPESEARYKTAFAQCKGAEISKVKKQMDQDLANVRKKFSQAQMVQLIETVTDMTGTHQVSHMVDRANLSSEDCEIAPNVFADPLTAAKLTQMNVDEPHGKILTEAEAKKVFDEVKNMKDIPFGYIRDGCHARAHTIAERLSEKDIAVGKVWVHGQNLWPSDKLAQQDPPGVGWRMHVAPFVYVKDAQGNIKKMVLDPSTQKGPVSVEQFVKSIQPKTENKIFYAKWPPVMDVQNFGRTVVNFSDKEYYSDAQMPPITAAQIQRDLMTADQVNMQYGQVLENGGFE
jgi:hypothetical protein